MEVQLNLDNLPIYNFSSYRTFIPGEHHVTRIFDFDVLILMLDGVLRFTEDGRDVELVGGDYYIQRSGLLQLGTAKSDVPHYYYVHFTGDFSPGEHSLPLRGKADVTALTSLFDSLDRLNSPNCHPEATQVKKNAIFYSILAGLYTNLKTAERDSVISTILTHLTADLSRPIELKEIARQCGYCENQLINVVRKHTGKTPYAYVTELRLERARRLLEETELPVSRISEDCGFGDYVNFYKHFVKSMGISPVKWRKTRRKG